MIPITDTIVLDEREIRERFVRSPGPGGQHVNKVATAVELRFDIRESSLPAAMKERLIALSGHHVTHDGVVVVVSRVHRSQLRNRDAARARLVTLLRRAATPPKARKPTKPGPAERQKRLVAKERQSAIKRARRLRDEE